MEINLRKARKLENKIAKHIETSTLDGVVAVRAKSNINEATEVITKAGTKLLDRLQTLRKLNEVRYSIRSQIANANQGVGINALMTEREQLKSKADILRKLGEVELAPATDVVNDLLATKALQLDKGDINTYGRPQVTVDVSVVTPQVRDSLNEEIKATIKGLEDVEDLLAQKNLGAKVALGNDEITLLKSEGLL